MTRAATTDELRAQIVAFGRRMYERGLIVATDGNLSCRLSDGNLLITPSGCCKGDLREDELLIVTPGGEVLEGPGRPSSELILHQVAYAERPDIGAVIHAHPEAAVAFSLAERDLGQDLLPEVVIGLGRIRMSGYATPTTPEVGEAVRKPIRVHDALILDRHGSVTLGRTLEQAYFRLERLEHAARVVWMSHSLGDIRPLSPRQVERLEQVRARYSGGQPAAGEPAAAPLDSPFPRRS